MTRRSNRLVGVLALVTVLLVAACGSDNKKSATASSSTTTTTTTAAPSCHDVTGTLTNQGVSPTELKGTLTGDPWLFGASHVVNLKTDPATHVSTSYATVTNEFGVLAGNDTGTPQPDGSAQDVWTMDPGASTGRYAGATGSVTFRNGDASGRVCVPHD
jgi:hypothetical protein